MRLLVGSYSQDLGFVDGHGEGVYAISDLVTAASSRVVVDRSLVANSSYLACIRDGGVDFVYVVDEREDLEHGGRLHAFVVVKDGVLKPVGPAVECAHKSTCHVVATTDHVIAANYAGAGPCGSIVCLRRDRSTGSLLPETRQVVQLPPCSRQYPGPVVQRQQTSHAHMVLLLRPSPPRAILVPDLGSDVVWRIEYSPQSGLGRASLACECAPGSGPRHAVLHPVQPVLLVITELASTLAVFKTNDEGDPVATTPTATVDVLPPEFQRPAHNTVTCAALRVSSRTSTVYCSIRIAGSHGRVCCVRLDPVTGLPMDDAVPTWFDSAGLVPREIVLVNDERTLLVANQDSDNIVAFDLDSETGLPCSTSPPRICTVARTPVCILDLGE